MQKDNRRVRSKEPVGSRCSLSEEENKVEMNVRRWHGFGDEGRRRTGDHKERRGTERKQHIEETVRRTKHELGLGRKSKHRNQRPKQERWVEREIETGEKRASDAISRRRIEIEVEIESLLGFW